MSRQRPHGTVGARCVWVTLALSAITLVGLRLHAYPLPLENDECNYAYIADRLLQGDRLYVDVWDHQPPGVFVLFAGLITVFGKSDVVFRASAIAASLVSLYLIHRIAVRCYGPLAGIMAAVLFALTSSDPGTAGEGCNREVFMNVCTLGALFMLVRARGARRDALIAGLLLGLGSTLKTVVAAHWLAMAAWTAAARWRTRGDARAAGRALVWLSLGPVAVWTAIFGFFAMTGRGWTFFDAVFRYNLDYGEVNRAFAHRFVDFFTPVFHVFDSARPLWVAALIAAPVWVILTRHRRARRDGAVPAYAVGAFLAVCLPGRFWPHYYYLLIPAAILVCVGLIARMGIGVSTARGRRAVWTCGWLWLACVGAFQMRHYAMIRPPDITAPHEKYRYRQSWSRAQGRRIAALTEPDDFVFVWGRDAGVYYYADRRCASRYTMVGALAEASPGVDERRTILLQELTDHRPRIVLVVEPEFAQLESFLKRNYRLASPRGVDRDDDNPQKIIMAALMDVDRPVKPIDWEWPESR